MADAIWTVLPMRGITQGKSRLALALDAAGRASLNRWLLTHTLAKVACWSNDLARCIVVSPCEETLDLAARHGAVALRETGSELNGALKQASGAAQAAGAQWILVLPCDLPELNVDALHALARLALQQRHMVLAPDRSGTGTNALLVDAGCDVEFQFGEASFQRHQAWAGEHMLTVAVCSRQELAFDLDTPEDLAQWNAATAAQSTRVDFAEWVRPG
jgi:2-phospho-L-lactate guanylyltransferase